MDLSRWAFPSTDSASQGAGTILNQVQFTYNDFGQLIEDQQSHSGTVGSGTPSVQYTYDPGSGTSNEIRLNALTYPNGRVLTYNFATGIDSILNRVTSISDSSATLASYTYLGAGTVIQITYPEPSVQLDLWGGTSGVFTGFDQFGRIINQPWINYSTSTMLDQYQYGYDQNSNRLWKANVVGTAAVSSGLDEFYVYDPLNRLTSMQRGVLAGGPPPTGITSPPVAEQDWTLDPTGNWAQFVTQAGGNVTMTQTRTANLVNEITAIGSVAPPPPPTGTPTPSTWVTPTYDAAGNTITIPQPAAPTATFAAVYDAWSRMVSIRAGSTAVGKYQYDGRNFRIVKQSYNSSGTLTETRDFYYTAAWRDIEEDVGGNMVHQYVWSLRYIDELVCRDDATPQRLYATQDANSNLTCIVDASSGVPLERYVFDPYGLRTIMKASWSAIPASAYNWVIGHQGLIIDPESGLISNRSRYFHPTLGCELTRDPLGYRSTRANLYEYCDAAPINRTDSLGLLSTADLVALVPALAGLSEETLALIAAGVGAAAWFLAVALVIALIEEIVRRNIKKSRCLNAYTSCMQSRGDKAANCLAVTPCPNELSKKTCYDILLEKFSADCSDALWRCQQTAFGTWIDPDFECIPCPDVGDLKPPPQTPHDGDGH